MAADGFSRHGLGAGRDPAFVARVAMAAGSTLDLEDLLGRLLAELRPLLPCESLGLLWREAASGLVLAAVPRLATHPDEGSGRVAIQGDEGPALLPVCALALSGANPALRELVARGLPTSAGVPVVVAGDPVGWLVASCRRRGSPCGRDLRPLVQMSRVAGPALHGILLRERLEVALADLASARNELTSSERLAMQVDLGYGVAHDINNLLSLIGARADLLGFQPLPERAAESVEAIRQAVDDGTSIIRRLTELARDQRGRATVPLDLDRVVAEALEMTRPRWQPTTGATPLVRVRFEHGPGPTVLAVPSELREVVVNLVMNALEAMPGGGDLTLTSSREGEWAVISVADTGCGMEEELVRHIFEPFYTTRVGHGSGLGLWVSHGIVARHGGALEVESRPGKGSTFRVRLPAHAPPGAATATGMHDQRRRILVADDEAGLAQAMKMCLEMAGYGVELATDGGQALEAFKRERFDLVITDLRMPGMNGWELALAVKALSPDVPIIAMTGWPVQHVGAGRHAPFEHILQKPCRMSDLQARVARLLQEQGRGGPAGVG